VFGATIAAAESLAACSLVALEAAAERNAELAAALVEPARLLARTVGSGVGRCRSRLHELLLGGLQRLAADTLAAHTP
jgi:hypothetical protein